MIWNKSIKGLKTQWYWKKWPEIPVQIVFYLIIYTNILEKLLIESDRTGVYRYKVEELEFTDRKFEN